MKNTMLVRTLVITLVLVSATAQVYAATAGSGFNATVTSSGAKTTTQTTTAVPGTSEAFSSQGSPAWSVNTQGGFGSVIPTEKIFKFSGQQVQVCSYDSWWTGKHTYPFHISTLEDASRWTKGVTFSCKDNIATISLGGTSIGSCTLNNDTKGAAAPIATTEKALLVDCYRFVNSQEAPADLLPQLEKRLSSLNCSAASGMTECQQIRDQIKAIQGGNVVCMTPNDSAITQCEKMTQSCKSIISPSDLQTKLTACKKITGPATPTPSTCGVGAKDQKNATGVTVCVCDDSSKVYDAAKKMCVPQGSTLPGVGKDECEKKGGTWESIPASAMPACHMPAVTPPAANTCTATPQCSAGPCKDGKCTQCTAPMRFNGTGCVFAGTQPPSPSGTCTNPENPNLYNGVCYAKCTGAASEFREGKCINPNPDTAPGAEQKECTDAGYPNKYNNGCYSACPENTEFKEGKCYPKQSQPKEPKEQACQQQGGQLFNGQCYKQDPAANTNNNNQNAAAQCAQKGGTWAQNQCLPGTPNTQQQGGQKNPAPGGSSQQGQQQAQQQAQQQCLAQGGQWNGYQCMPPAFNPYTSPYFNQQVANKPTCNFFGASQTEVPIGESVEVSWEVTGASTISLDTSPKSTTKYTRGSVSLNTVTQQIGAETGTPTSKSTITGATITPSMKGTLTLRLKMNNLLQNSDPCKPIKLQVVDKVDDGAATDTTYDNTQGNAQVTEDSGVGQLDQSSTDSGIGQEVELASDIARQKRDAAQKAQEAEAAKNNQTGGVTEATYEKLCALFGIGCSGGDVAPVSRNVQSEIIEQPTPVERLTIAVQNDSNVDVPNVGVIDAELQPTTGGGGFTQIRYINSDPTIVAYDPQSAEKNGVVQYIENNAQYAPDQTGNQSSTTGQLKQIDGDEAATAETKPGVFTRMWRWFIGLLGFGPEQV